MDAGTVRTQSVASRIRITGPESVGSESSSRENDQGRSPRQLLRIVWDGGADYAYGYFSGKASANGFSGKGKAGGKCMAKVIGHLGTNNDIVGTYDFQHCKTKTSNFIAVGRSTPLNNSGCANIIRNSHCTGARASYDTAPAFSFLEIGSRAASP